MTHRTFPKREQLKKRSSGKRVLPPWKLRKKAIKQLEKELIGLWQAIVKRNAGLQCEITNDKGILQAHHVYHRGSCPVLRYNPLNGVCLSVGQHFKAHKQGEASLIAFLIEKRGIEWFDNLKAIRSNAEQDHFQWTIELLQEQKLKLMEELERL
jgi:membrane carboxypeptidase/penicillin-binding protein PbpC